MFGVALPSNILRMPQEPLHMEEHAGSRAGLQILRMSGTLTLSNIFGFQSKVRAGQSRALILDFLKVLFVQSDL